MRVFAAKIFRAVASLLLLTLACVASASDQATLRLEISGLAQVTGKVYFSVYDSPDTWLGEDRVAGGVVDIGESLQGEVVIAAVDLSPGEYAVSVFYDVDAGGGCRPDVDFRFVDGTAVYQGVREGLTHSLRDVGPIPPLRGIS